VKIKKREVLKRLLEIEGSKPATFWKKEMTLLNKLLKEYPEPRFWSFFQFERKINSLALAFDGYYKSYLAEKYKQYCFDLNFKIPESEDIKVYDKSFGEDITYKKRFSLKSLFSNSKKKKD